MQNLSFEGCPLQVNFVKVRVSVNVTQISQPAIHNAQFNVSPASSRTLTDCANNGPLVSVWFVCIGSRLDIQVHTCSTV